MPALMTRLRLLLALGLAATAVSAPSASAAQVKWTCEATPLSGTLFGRTLPNPTAGTIAGDCGDSTVSSLGLTDPLARLLTASAVNGMTIVNEKGALAGAGLANVKIGSVPIPVGEITIPDALTKVSVGLPPANLPVATVDLTPAIKALSFLPSKNFLDAGVLYSNVLGSCDGGTARITGASQVTGVNVLGLPADAANTVDGVVNLLDTRSVALDSLDLTLAKVTLLGGVVNVTPEQVLGALGPIVAALPPLEIPEQLATVKLTPSTQTNADGLLVQRAMRAQISLAGISIADLDVGEAKLGGACVPDTPAAPELALECTARKLALIDVVRHGDHVRLYGAADKSLAGKTARIVFQATRQAVAHTRIQPDGSFTTTAPLPPAKVRGTNRARYVALAGGERSLNLKLTRRMVVSDIASDARTVTITGRVVGPLASPPEPIVLKRRVTCSRLETVKEFLPFSDGGFSVTVRKPANLAATVYRLQTRVRRTKSSDKLYPTFTLPRAVDL